MNPHLSRRDAMRLAGTLALGVSAFPTFVAKSSFLQQPRRFRLGACDWSIGLHSEVEALRLAREIGLDGVQVSLGKYENHMHLRQKAVQKRYRRAARRHRIEVASLAIGELNQYPYASHPEAEGWVRDSISVAKAMGCPIVLLAFFSKGDINGKPEAIQQVISRLKRVAPHAEKNGITLGIESWLRAEDHMRILDAVASPNVKVYYDVANSLRMGYDIYAEIRWLGKANICEFHLKENGALLGQGKVDFERVKAAIDDIGYEGWLIIEGALPPEAEVLPAYRANARYLHSIFPLISP